MRINSLFLIFIFFYSCKNDRRILPNEEEKEKIVSIDDIFIDSTFYSNEERLEIYNYKTYTERNNEIFIGKKFYEGDELNHFLFMKSNIVTPDSIYNYSIYKNKRDLIFSLEKLISHEDVKQFLIVDTLLFFKKNKYEIQIKNKITKDSVLLFNRTKAIKFKFSNKKIKQSSNDQQ